MIRVSSESEGRRDAIYDHLSRAGDRATEHESYNPTAGCDCPANRGESPIPIADRIAGCWTLLPDGRLRVSFPGHEIENECVHVNLRLNPLPHENPRAHEALAKV